MPSRYIWHLQNVKSCRPEERGDKKPPCSSEISRYARNDKAVVFPFLRIQPGPFAKRPTPPMKVIPAESGIHRFQWAPDSSLRWSDTLFKTFYGNETSHPCEPGYFSRWSRGHDMPTCIDRRSHRPSSVLFLSGPEPPLAKSWNNRKPAGAPVQKFGDEPTRDELNDLMN